MVLMRIRAGLEVAKYGAIRRFVVEVPTVGTPSC